MGALRLDIAARTLREIVGRRLRWLPVNTRSGARIDVTFSPKWLGQTFNERDVPHVVSEIIAEWLRLRNLTGLALVDPADMEDVRKEVNELVSRRLNQHLHWEQSRGIDRARIWPKLPEHEHYLASDLANDPSWWVGKYRVRLINGRAQYCLVEWRAKRTRVQLTHLRDECPFCFRSGKSVRFVGPSTRLRMIAVMTA